MSESGVRSFIGLSNDRWPVAGPEQAKWGIPGVVLCLLGAQVFAVVWFSIAAGLRYGSDPLPAAADRPIWTLLLFNAGLWVGYGLGPILAKRMTDSGPMLDFDVRSSRIEGVVAVVIGVVTQLAVLPVVYWVLLQFLSGDPGESAQALTDRVDGPLDVIVLVVAVVLIAPVVEEWFYRGMMLPTLARRFGVVGGAVGSSAVFALVHQEFILMPGLFLLSLLLSWLTIRTARIGPAIIAHMAFNATTVVQLLVFQA